MLDFVGIEYGESAAASVAGAVGIARAVEAAGYRRYWVSEHHNMTSLACSAPERVRELARSQQFLRSRRTGSFEALARAWREAA